MLRDARRPEAGWSRIVGVLLLVFVGATLSTAAAQGVDIEAVFWCEEPGAEEDLSMDACLQARELILFQCTACHTFVPVVKAQKTEEQWRATFDVHEEDRLSELSAEEVDLVFRYVVSHFNPDQPVPELPAALEEQSTNQAF